MLYVWQDELIITQSVDVDVVGTIMMSGCGILTNGKGTRREYGVYNLDELTVGDRKSLSVFIKDPVNIKNQCPIPVNKNVSSEELIVVYEAIVLKHPQY